MSLSSFSVFRVILHYNIAMKMCRGCLYSDVLFSNVLFISDTVYQEIFEDGHLVIIDSNGTMRFCVVKISRLQANPQKQ